MLLLLTRSINPHYVRDKLTPSSCCSTSKSNFHQCFATLHSLTNWWIHFYLICLSSRNEHVDTEDTEFPALVLILWACFREQKEEEESRFYIRMGGRRSQMHLCVFSSQSLLYIFQEKNKLRRDQSHIWVNQMSSRAATYVSVCFWHFLSAVIGVFLSFFFFFLRLHRCLGEEFVQRSPPFLAGLWRFDVVCLKDTRAGQMLAVIERFEWSFCVKWKDLWWLMCWVSLMTLEFFERGFLKPSHIWKDTRVLVEKYKTEEWIICKKDFYFRRWEWIMTHLRSSPLSLSLALQLHVLNWNFCPAVIWSDF